MGFLYFKLGEVLILLNVEGWDMEISDLPTFLLSNLFQLSTHNQSLRQRMDKPLVVFTILRPALPML